MQRFDLAGYERACDLTWSILRRAGVTAPAVPIRDICRFYGLEVVEKNIAPRKAMLCKRLETIFVQPGESPEQRVRIAHELGHWLLPATYLEVSHDLFSWCILSPHEWVSDISNPNAARLVAEAHALPLSVAKKRVRLFEYWHRFQTSLIIPKGESQHGTNSSQGHGAA